MAKYDNIDFTPPQGVQDEAAKGLEWRREYGRGGTEVGVARARDLSNGKNISPETVNRMVSYFARHEVDKQGEGWRPGQDGFPSAGRIAWALWGGDPGKAWAGKLKKQMEAPQARSIMKTLLIDSVIGTGEGEISAKMVRDWLAELDGSEPITVKIHSEGGSVHEGFGIHDALANYPGEKNFVVESMAFSIASFIPMSGKVTISPNGYMMLHNPYVAMEGNSDDLTKTASLLSQLKETMVTAYSKKSGLDADTIRGIMQSETFLNADDAVRLGLADAITESPKVGRPVSPNSLLKLPHGVVMALFGNSPDLPKETKMSQTATRVAAMPKAIKAKFPRASAEFVVRCMEKEMTMEEVTDEYMEETEEESISLKAQVEELQAKVKAMEEEKLTAKAKAEEMKPAARAGVQAIAQGTGVQTRGSAKAVWLGEVQARMKNGLPRDRAMVAVDRDNPELRRAYLDEING
jgi:ATP-dependent protease ClpP protease subunit